MENKYDNEYSNFVAALAKPGETIRSSLTANDCHMLHMIIGVSGEAGELLDAVKKAVIYRKELDMVNIIEELGDIEFYLEGLRQSVGVSRDFIIQINQEKLRKRYAKGYSDKAAQDREDKK